MEVLIVVAAFAVVGLFLLAVILWVMHLEKKRTAGMRAVADALGLEFSKSAHDQLLGRLANFQLFNNGRGRVMNNVILGETDLATIAIFDYRYTIGSGKSQTTHNQTVVAMESDSLKLPSFTLRPENIFDKVGSALGFQDIDFAEHQQFSKLFVLKGQDEAAIREFFDTKMLDFFADRPGTCFECGLGMFIYFRAGKKQKVTDLRKYLEDGYSVYQELADRLSRT